MHFQLVPFDTGSKIAISGDFRYEDDRITVVYDLVGKIEDIKIPPRVEGCPRADDLWKSTCFEFFLGEAEGAAYLEINLSPSGAWNAYEFSDMRQGMREAPQMKLDHHTFDSSDQSVALRAGFELTEILRRPLRLGISAVIEHESQNGDNRLSYHALIHGDRPDFHARANHLLRMD